MKKNLSIFFICFLINSFSYSQGVIKIEDPHIRAQQERMVFKSWGNFLPKPKYVKVLGTEIGPNINPHYTATWGWLAPSDNKKYKNGKDIRPLGPMGEQTQRMSFNMFMLESSNNYKKDADKIGRTAESEFLYNTSVTAPADPLWLLYYKEVLKPVLEFGESNEILNAQMAFKTYQYLKKNGVIDWYNGEMRVLKDKLQGAFKSPMERGSRIIMYHDIYDDYKKIQAEFNNHISWSSTFMNMNMQMDRLKNDTPSEWEMSSNTDSEIMQKVLNSVKNINKYKDYEKVELDKVKFEKFNKK